MDICNMSWIFPIFAVGTFSFAFVEHKCKD